jgi:N-acetylglucosamine kinase-like BadF-type ATPase
LRVGGRVLDVEGPGANVTTLEQRLVDQRLSSLLDGLGEAQPDACCAGAAGAEVPAAASRLRDLLERRLPGCRVSVVHDTRLALAAAGLDAGIVLIAGTGSVAYARAADGREARRGGWGWMVGDEGSGAWVAREAARVVLGRADDGLELGPLGASLLAACGAESAQALKAALHGLRESGRWAALASAVFEAEATDPAASAIVALVTPLRELVAGPVVLAGGLLLHRPTLEDAVRERLPLRCLRLEQPPVEGAVRLAEALLAR